MKNFQNIDEILDFAIANEQQAADFYNKLSSESVEKQMKDTFSAFAKEEMGHKARLEKVKNDRIFEEQQEDVLDMKISDYIVSSPTSDKMTYQEALVLAMKREKAAFRLYIKLSELAPDEKFKTIFKNLANDEAKHKLNFELEYDDVIYREN